MYRTVAIVLALLACTLAVYAVPGPFVYPNVMSLKNQRKRKSSDQCATMVQLKMAAIGKPMGLTRTWLSGIKVRGNGAKIASGTAIGTFLASATNTGNGGGCYNNKYGRHTGFYVSQTSAGVQIIHTWGGPSTIAYGTLSYTSTRSFHMNGNQYYVVLNKENRNVPSYTRYTVKGNRNGRSGYTFYVFRETYAATGPTGGGESEGSNPPPANPPPVSWNPPSAPVSGDSSTLSGRKQIVRATLKQVFTNVDDKGISAMMGNIAVETGSFDWKQKQYGGNGYGLFQYDFMKKYYFRWLGSRTDSALMQIKYAYECIYGPELNMLGAGNAAKLKRSLESSSYSTRQKTLDFMKIFEKPGVPHESKRIAAAEADYRANAGRSSPPPPPPVRPPPPPPAPPVWNPAPPVRSPPVWNPSPPANPPPFSWNPPPANPPPFRWTPVSPPPPFRWNPSSFTPRASPPTNFWSSWSWGN